uniref:Uncharacterized protein n=1 Tax=Aegilops tauschii subsp. strangulata TaxID=200361 RepID=A0A452ZJA5_AEGTS
MGGMLHSGDNVHHEHPAIPKVLPVHRPIPPLREHHVGDQVQRHDLRAVPARERLRVGGHQEVGPVLRGRPRGPRREAHRAAAAEGRVGPGPRRAGGQGLVAPQEGRPQEEAEAQQDLPEGAGAVVPPADGGGAQRAVGAGHPLLLPPVPGRLLPRHGPRPDRRASGVILISMTAATEDRYDGGYFSYFAGIKGALCKGRQRLMLTGGSSL